MWLSLCRCRFRAQRNRDMGWARDSWVPQKHYTSDTMSLAAGPLIWDVALCNDAYDRGTEAFAISRFMKLMCTQCGFPECSCLYCSQKMKALGSGAKTNPTAKGGHSCWRAGGRRPQMDSAVVEECKQAWLTRGCTLEVVYFAINSAFGFKTFEHDEL
jgi:hypothetical protein